MKKGVHISDLTWAEKVQIHSSLKEQSKGIEWLERAFKLAWIDYKAGKFKYDGATFVSELNNEFWELAAFIHDWLNGIGYVGAAVDLYFIKIMIVLNYPESMIIERYKLMRFTFVNVFIHKYIKRDFVSTNIPNHLQDA